MYMYTKIYMHKYFFCLRKSRGLNCVDSSFVPPLVYALLGSSRDLAIGPVAVASILISSMLEKTVNPNENPKLYVQLAITSTFFAGVFQAALGFLRSVRIFNGKYIYPYTYRHMFLYAYQHTPAGIYMEPIL